MKEGEEDGEDGKRRMMGRDGGRGDEIKEGVVVLRMREDGVEGRWEGMGKREKGGVCAPDETMREKMGGDE